ncbi:MAG: DUF1707 SHOCT-like domain-containing protein [Longimicrobiales bacterium]
MPGEQPDPNSPTLALRNQVVDALTEQFAADGLTLEEFESKLDVVHRAQTPQALQALLGTLKPATTGGGGRPLPARRVSESTVPARSLLFGFWGGSQRSGSWIPAKRNFAVAFQGGVELDLREARFGPGVTDITVFCAMGGVNIIVPPNLQVDFGGVGIMGGFDAESGTQPVIDEDGPVVRIRGVAIWGGAAVEIRHSGETASHARQRRRLAKRIHKELPPAE